MKENLTPREIFNRLHEFVMNYNADRQANLFAEDGVWELLFAPEGIPNIIKGRENIRAMGKAGMDRSKRSGRKITGYNPLIIYETDNSEVIIAEFTLHGEITNSGEKYKIPYIQVLQVHNGLIAKLRDYFPGEIIKEGLEANE